MNAQLEDTNIGWGVSSWRRHKPLGEVGGGKGGGSLTPNRAIPTYNLSKSDCLTP